MVIKMMSSTGTYVPQDVSTVKTLNKVSQIIALILGIGLIILGIITLIFIVGILYLILGIINLLIFYEIREIDSLIDLQRYNDAKNKTFVWMIIGFLSGIIVGIILLIAWIKYDDIIRAVQQSYMQQGPVPPTPPPQ